MVASLAEAWIEILPLFPVFARYTVASLAEAWIEMLSPFDREAARFVASLAEAWIEIWEDNLAAKSDESRLPRGGVD